jgi:hypothetical protein
MAIGGALDLGINLAALVLVFFSHGRVRRLILGKKKAPSNS